MLELVLVRHGQSEGNVAYRRSLAGDHSLYSGRCVFHIYYICNNICV